MKKRLAVLLAAAIVSLFSMPASGAEKIRLMLDWFPNVDHIPIYLARERGFFAEKGLSVEILSPSDTADALKLAVSGNVDVAVSYEPQAVIAAAGRLDIRVIGRLVEHPLTTLLFLDGKGIRTPADLAGKRIGYTVPGLMDVLLAAFARINGIETYTPVNVGFTIVPALTAGKVDAVMGPFKTYETVGMRHRGLRPAYFELEKWGIPDYDELIFVCGSKGLERREKALGAFVAAVARGIAAAADDPDQALADYFRAVPEADQKTETDAFRLTLPYFARTQVHDTARWQRFADFAHRHGLIERPVAASSILKQWDRP